ncbi:MAG TPA: hypothetical protein VNK52_10925 [Hyphomicrobiaceae bacterium]|nr:hypothetical protein [Hyphomicrobiaceae bacterium]
MSMSCAGVAVGGLPILAYLAILGSSLAGYAGLPPYAVVVSAIALASISYSENFGLYRRGQEGAWMPACAGMTGLLGAHGCVALNRHPDVGRVASLSTVIPT